MTDIDAAVNGITRITTVGILAGATFKTLDNVNRMAKTPKRKRKTHRRKH